MDALTPIWVSISRIAFALSLSLLARRPTPERRLVPWQNAASTEMIGKRSGQFDASTLNALRGALCAVMLPVSPSSCERLAPASMSMSITERSAWRDVVSSPCSSVLPNIAPATRKLAAALQSPSRSMSAALYFCPPLTLKTISVHSDQSPSDSRKSLPPSMSFPILMPNFLRTSRVMNMYGMLLGSWTMSDELRSANGRAIRRPEISWEPCLPEISARPAFSGPAAVRGTHTGASSSSRMILASNASRISFAPVRGRPRRVFSPVKCTGPWQSWVMRGIIILVSRPDSPTWRVYSSAPMLPRCAAIPLIVNDVPSTDTSAPRLRATCSAASLSPHGVYPFRCDVPSANAAAIMALCAKLLDTGICNASLSMNPKSPYTALRSSSAGHWPGAAGSSSDNAAYVYGAPYFRQSRRD